MTRVIVIATINQRMSSRLENDLAQRVEHFPGYQASPGGYVTEVQVMPGTEFKGFFVVLQEGDEYQTFYSPMVSDETLASESFQDALREYIGKLFFPNHITIPGLSPDISSILSITLVGKFDYEETDMSTPLLLIAPVPPEDAAEAFDR